MHIRVVLLYFACCAYLINRMRSSNRKYSCMCLDTTRLWRRSEMCPLSLFLFLPTFVVAVVDVHGFCKVLNRVCKPQLISARKEPIVEAAHDV